MLSKYPIINIPNALSLIRLVRVPFLFPLAGLDNLMYFLGWYVLLGLTDWLDGMLARKWNQTSELGSALDSIADLAYYISTAYFLVKLFPEYVMPSLYFIYGFFVLLAISMIFSWVKCRRFVMLHTHLSRLNGVLVFLIMIASFWMDTSLAVSAVLLIYYLAFIEIILIFVKFGDVSADTRSIFILLRDTEKPLP